MLFEQLLSGLPEEYSTTRAVIDTQSNFTVQDKLYILTKQEDRLATESAQKALAAQSVMQRRSGSKRRARYDSGSESEGSQYRQPTCWACKAYRHLVQDCPIILQFQIFVKNLGSTNLQTEKTKKKETGSGQSVKNKAKSVKDKNISENTLYCCYKRYIANNNLSDTDTEPSDPNLSDSDKEEAVEVTAYSQDFGKVALS